MLPVEIAPSPNHQRRNRASPCRFHPFIHPSAHAHSLCTDCAAFMTKSSQQQTSKRASESIAQETERTCTRDDPAAFQVPTIPGPKQTQSLARSLARSFAPSGIQPYVSFESASLSSYFLCTVRRRRTRDRPNDAPPHIPALVSHPSFPPCPPRAHPSIQKTSARARVRACTQAKA